MVLLRPVPLPLLGVGESDSLGRRLTTLLGVRTKAAGGVLSILLVDLDSIRLPAEALSALGELNAAREGGILLEDRVDIKSKLMPPLEDNNTDEKCSQGA